MTKSTKQRSLLGVAAMVALLAAWLLLRPSSAESKFKALFSGLASGVPTYQKILIFEQPADAAQGDFCNTEFTQTQDQMDLFLARLGITPQSVLTLNGMTAKVNSKIDPRYPWLLNVKAEPIGYPLGSFKIHIEGRQPYNSVDKMPFSTDTN